MQNKCLYMYDQNQRKESVCIYTIKTNAKQVFVYIRSKLSACRFLGFLKMMTHVIVDVESDMSCDFK